MLSGTSNSVAPGRHSTYVCYNEGLVRRLTALAAHLFKCVGGDHETLGALNHDAGRLRIQFGHTGVSVIVQRH